MARSHPIFATLYDAMMKPAERRLFGRLRTKVLQGIQGEVLEIGTGTGVNFSHVAGRPDLEWTATEPDLHMRRKAELRASDLGFSAKFIDSAAEGLPFPDQSFDYVVVTLVLCTVEDLSRSLNEVWRVLRPGGELRVLEHVRATGWLGRVQDVLRPAWSVVGAGCQLNRRTGDLIKGLAGAEVELETLPAPFPVGAIALGKARKPKG
jgi:ubiquinone/menaquinone biosynthesis C-methylase UbiE